MLPNQRGETSPAADDLLPERQSNQQTPSQSASGEWPANISGDLKSYLEATFKARPGGPVPASGRHFYSKEVEKLATAGDDSDLIPAESDED